MVSEFAMAWGIEEEERGALAGRGVVFAAVAVGFASGVGGEGAKGCLGGLRGVGFAGVAGGEMGEEGSFAATAWAS